MTKEKNDMTNEHNFKVGDTVRIHDGKEIYKITEICNGLYRLSDGKGLWGDRYLTLVEPYDRRTAFLTCLQSLLREFDARIYDHDDYRLYIDLGIHGDTSERIVYSDTEGEINADNIMNFNKE